MQGYGLLTAATGLAAAGLLLAACTNSPTATGTGAAPAASNAPIGTSSVAGVGTVVVDSVGKTLYFSDQDANGTVRCTGDCLNVWIPATASSTSPPRGSVTGLSVIKRSDNGKDQFAYQGKPLYEFRMDTMAGQFNGNGARDQFNGTPLTWHTAVVPGTAGAPDSTSGTSGGNPGY